jgi:hypothetical protein
VKKFPWLAAWLIVLVGSSPVFAVDLSKIDRSIAKEPVYKSTPKYCLLVFGPEAKTRVWLVLDGDVLYVDRNHNGDLTEEGEKTDVQMIKQEGNDTAKKIPTFRAGDVQEIENDPKHRNLTIEMGLFDGGRSPDCAITIERSDRHEQTAQVEFANYLGDAPIVHLNGPLAARPLATGIQLVRGQTYKYKMMIGTQGYIDEKKVWLFSKLSIEHVPLYLHPIVEIEFPSAGMKGEFIKRKFLLAQRC